MAKDNGKRVANNKNHSLFCFFPPVCPCLLCPVKLLVKQDRPPCLFSKNLAVIVSALPEHSRAMWMFMAIVVLLNT